MQLKINKSTLSAIGITIFLALFSGIMFLTTRDVDGQEDRSGANIYLPIIGTMEISLPIVEEIDWYVENWQLTEDDWDYWAKELLEAPGVSSPEFTRAVYAAPPSMNIATGYTAMQSSINNNASPSRAVDGVIKTEGNSLTMAQTNFELQPWWQVDLNSSYVIDQVRLYSPTDCCSENLKEFYILISNEDMLDSTLDELLANPNVESWYIEDSVEGNETFDTPAVGRFVRVQRKDRGVLQIMETHVYGKNLALEKPVKQSGDFADTTGAEKAVDGDVNGALDGGSIASTDSGPQRWWQVDLGESHDIGRIWLFDCKVDCHGGVLARLAYFHVFTSDTDMSNRTIDDLQNDPDVWEYFEVDGIGFRYMVAAGNAKGRYVLIKRKASGPVNLAEVVINGVPSDQVSTVTLNPHQYGQWSDPIEWPHISVHASLMPDGKLLTWDATPDDFVPIHDPHTSDNKTTRATVWDPITGVHTEVRNNTNTDLFCAGSNHLADGSLFVAGGTKLYNRPINATQVFDFKTETWTLGPELKQPRWYPTVTDLADGTMLISGGRGANPELYEPSDKTLRRFSGITLGGNWPILRQAPDGTIVYAGGDGNANIYTLELSGVGKLNSINNSSPLNNAATHALYDIGKMLYTGGNDKTRSGETSTRHESKILDLNTQEVTEISVMNYRRFRHNLTILADGSVMAVGGGSQLGNSFCATEQSSYAGEIWNPETQEWSIMASQDRPRQYHSTSVLLPDGRVWSGGSGYATTVSNQRANCPYQNTSEIFSPPYLFNTDGSLATRPVISSSPESADYDSQFNIVTSNASDIKKVGLVKLSAVTHKLNVGQRYVPLQIEIKDGSTIEATTPLNPNYATAGYYMLFVINNQGTPSISKMIRLGEPDTTIGPSDLLAKIEPVESAQVDTLVTFIGSATGADTVTFKWDFGDETVTEFSANPSATHQYSQPGTYSVRLTVRDEVSKAEAVDTITVAVFGKPTANQPTQSTSILYEANNGGRVWNVNPDNNSVTIINAITNEKIDEIAVGEAPRTLALNPNGDVWVVNKTGSSISIIDPVSLAVKQTLPFQKGASPFGLAFSPDDTVAYLAFENTGELVMLHPNTGARLSSIDLGQHIRHVSVADDGKAVYVTRFITPLVTGESTANPDLGGHGGEVLKIAVLGSSMTLEKTIKLKQSKQPDTESGARGLPNYLGPVAISPDGLYGWIPSKQDNIVRGGLRDGLELNHDRTLRSITSRINLNTEREMRNMRIDHDNGGIASAAVFEPNGNYLFVALEGSREVAVIDANANSEIGRVEVGIAPQGLVVSPDSLKLFVHNFLDRSISVLDLTDLIRESDADLPVVKVVAAVDTEVLPTTVLKGKQLFYDAFDTRLADERYISCASCHNDGGHDGRVWDFTASGEGVRNTITLVGHGGPSHGRLHWSGNFDEIHDFEGQIRALAGGTGLMSDADFNASSFPLGPKKAGKSADLDALAAYVNSLTTVGVSPFRQANGQLTPEGAAGKQVFVSQGCAQCHSGEAYTDSATATVHDIGTMNAASGNRLDGELHGIDTPTLLGLWNTAPYLHNGTAPTLKDAILAHDGVDEEDFDGNELLNLVQYLLQLDDSGGD